MSLPKRVKIRLLLTKEIVQKLVTIVRQNTSIDRNRKEQVRALLHSRIKYLLVEYYYPSDKQETAVVSAIYQNECLAAEVIA